jgi:hypothetical protein
MGPGRDLARDGVTVLQNRQQLAVERDENLAIPDILF